MMMMMIMIWGRMMMMMLMMMMMMMMGDLNMGTAPCMRAVEPHFVLWDVIDLQILYKYYRPANIRDKIWSELWSSKNADNRLIRKLGNYQTSPAGFAWQLASFRVIAPTPSWERWCWWRWGCSRWWWWSREVWIGEYNNGDGDGEHFNDGDYIHLINGWCWNRHRHLLLFLIAPKKFISIFVIFSIRLYSHFILLPTWSVEITWGLYKV